MTKKEEIAGCEGGVLVLTNLFGFFCVAPNVLPLPANALKPGGSWKVGDFRGEVSLLALEVEEIGTKVPDLMVCVEPDLLRRSMMLGLPSFEASFFFFDF